MLEKSGIRVLKLKTCDSCRVHYFVVYERSVVHSSNTNALNVESVFEAVKYAGEFTLDRNRLNALLATITLPVDSKIYCKLSRATRLFSVSGVSGHLSDHESHSLLRETNNTGVHYQW